MAFTLEEVVPWGRSYEEYISMFSLTTDDLEKKILGCADGPASFNADLTRKSGEIISTDPLYAFSCKEIKKRIDETFTAVLEQTRLNQHEFVWTKIKTPGELGKIRMEAMELFLTDYEKGLAEKRYINASLPNLPFTDKSFDIALCSHFLFLYSEQLSEEFHINAINELCRIAAEVRIFPLLELGSKESRHLNNVVKIMQKSDINAEIKTVDYEFQKNGNKMLLIKS